MAGYTVVCCTLARASARGVYRPTYSHLLHIMAKWPNGQWVTVTCDYCDCRIEMEIAEVGQLLRQLLLTAQTAAAE